MAKARNLQKYLLIGGALLLLIYLSTLLGMAARQENLILSQTHVGAQGLFENIVFARRWSADFGGVYVLKGPGVESNPYLVRPDIQTVDGKTYTLKNPALMTREISSFAKEAGEFEYHITSLKLLNPENRPDDWERQSLDQFEQGTTEVTQVTERDGKRVFRLMRPLKYEVGCVRCHASQGYEVGQIRGGISVTLPYEQ
ncbi:DUF3365 domain-containing protein, partial [Candidatus Sumerlaeota bacterium]